jgi:hypothetical protein
MKRCGFPQLLVIIAAVAATSAFAQQFQTAHTYNAGTNSSQMAVGDFNNDGYQDLVVTNNGGARNPNTVTVLLASPSGTFGAPVTYATAAPPSGVVVADFNRDGKQDLAVATARGVNIYLGNGDGTFQSAARYSEFVNGSFIVAGDFNGDGKLDLMVLTAGGIYFLAGNGDGTLETATLAATGEFDGALATSDLNGDGKLDLVTLGTESSNVAVLLGNGNGTLQTPVNYLVGTYPQSLVIADLNGDGKADIAVTECASTTECAVPDPISILPGKGDGTFGAAHTFTDVTDESALGIAAADFDGDGKMDLIIADSYSNDVTELLGNGNGTFKRGQNWAAGEAPHVVVVGDFNHNGVPDVATLNQLGTVNVFLGNKNGSFKAARDAINNIQPLSVAAGDFNGDGIVDLAVGN